MARFQLRHGWSAPQDHFSQAQSKFDLFKVPLRIELVALIMLHSLRIHNLNRHKLNVNFAKRDIDLKVHKHEIVLIFFAYTKPWPLFEKNFKSFISVFARISMFEHFRGDWASEKPIFCWKVSKKLIGARGRIKEYGRQGTGQVRQGTEDGRKWAESWDRG